MISILLAFPALLATEATGVTPAITTELTESRSVLFTADRGRHVLLQRVPGAECAGKLRLSADGEAVICRAPPLEAEPHQHFVGRQLVLHGADQSCLVEVTEISLITWYEQEDGIRRAGSAQAAWERAAYDDRFVAARVKSVDGRRCPGARWAEEVESQSHLQVGHSPERAEQKEAVARFRRHPGHAALQARFEAETGRTGMWDDAQVRVRVLPTRTGQFVFAGAQVGGCGEFSADFWVIWQVSSQGDYTVLTDSDVVGGWFEPEALVERPDGRPTFFDAHLRVEPRGAGYQVVEDVAVETWSCPC